jgi:hypothetical protein
MTSGLPWSADCFKRLHVIFPINDDRNFTPDRLMIVTTAILAVCGLSASLMK